MIWKTRGDHLTPQILNTHTHSSVCMSVCKLSSGINLTHNCTCTHTHTLFQTLSSFVQAGQLFVYPRPRPEGLGETHLFSLLCGCKLLPVFLLFFSSFYVTMLHHCCARVLSINPCPPVCMYMNSGFLRPQRQTANRANPKITRRFSIV